MSNSASAKYYGEKKVKSLWEQICDEFAAKRALMENTEFDDTTSVVTDVTQYSARRHTPIVYDSYIHRTPIDTNVEEEFDPAVGHPAAVGLSMVTKPKPPPTPPPEEPPDPKTCTPKEYLEYYLFPILLPGMAAMMKEAKKEKCFVRKVFRFNGCDFLTEYLYQHNKSKLKEEPERANMKLDDIDFVKVWKEASKSPDFSSKDLVANADSASKNATVDSPSKSATSKSATVDSPCKSATSKSAMVDSPSKSATSASKSATVDSPSKIPSSKSATSKSATVESLTRESTSTASRVKPRKPLPLSLQYTEDEAANRIQAYYRGHRVRVRPDVAELRQWQKDWRIENHGVRHQIQEFWEKHESILSLIDSPDVSKSEELISPPAETAAAPKQPLNLCERCMHLFTLPRTECVEVQTSDQVAEEVEETPN